MPPISVVIQGPVYDVVPERSFGTEDVVQAWRRLIGDDCSIIISTWKNKHAINISADRIVTSEDPGETLPRAVGRTTQNHNRMIVSTVAGLKTATTEYIIKSRTDILPIKCEVSGILGCLQTQNRTKKYAMFKMPIGVFYKYTYNSNAVISARQYFYPVQRHLSDIVQIGKRHDLLDYWSAPLLNTKTFYNNLSTADNLLSAHDNIDRPESYLFHHWAAKHGYPLPNYTTNSRPYLRWSYRSERLMYANFYVFDDAQCLVTGPKHFDKPTFPPVFSAKTFSVMQRLSNNTCGLSCIVLRCLQRLREAVFLFEPCWNRWMARLRPLKHKLFRCFI